MKYVCSICGYLYDDDKETIPFDQLEDDWKCPLCGAAKADFVPQKEENVQTIQPQQSIEPIVEKDTRLSLGQLAALCSNLARGCEKQYKAEEAAKFRQLAAYFGSITPAVEDAGVELIASQLKADINEKLPAAKSARVQEADRGAQRACTWAEKVSRMLNSLIGRYQAEGETMLADAEVWVCTICGFVFIGSNPPELCPVCKVPAWKFEKMEGRAKA